MEANNMAAVRNALMQIYDRVNSLDENCGVDPVEIRDIARAALAEPVKNYEVGTVEEQQARHCAWCRKHGIDGDNTVDCIHPDMSCGSCALAWAQMSYEKAEGGSR